MPTWRLDGSHGKRLCQVPRRNPKLPHGGLLQGVLRIQGIVLRIPRKCGLSILLGVRDEFPLSSYLALGLFYSVKGTQATNDTRRHHTCERRGKDPSFMLAHVEVNVHIPAS